MRSALTGRGAAAVTTTAAVLLFAASCRDGPPGSPPSSARGIVVAAESLAAEVGADVLASGGNAVDAAVGTAFALAVTYPSAGNIGGGGFMVVRLADGTATTFDYRERAPLAATPTMYLDARGRIQGAATDSGWRAPGVPGTVAGLALAHRRLGRRPWPELVAPAVALAERGFPLSSARAAELNEVLGGFLRPYPASVAAYGKPGGGAWIAGDTLRLPQLGRALRAIAEEGANAFYRGWIADSIDAQMRANGGLIRRADLEAYEPIERAPLRGRAFGHEFISMGPPSSGGLVLLEVLAQLEALGIAAGPLDDADAVHARVEAARRAFLDRARWLGDPDFGSVPVERLMAKTYAESLAATIDRARASASARLGADILASPESPQTTHFSIVDADGNAVANTYTIEGWYGSAVTVAGFLLNNEMGDFNKKPGHTTSGWTIGTPPNTIAPGKRMLSSMTPVIVTRDGALRLVTGASGGRTIPTSVLRIVLGVLVAGEEPQAAVDARRSHHQWMPDTIFAERGALSGATASRLRAMGHAILDVEDDWGFGDAQTIAYDAAAGRARGLPDRRAPDARAAVPRSR